MDMQKTLMMLGIVFVAVAFLGCLGDGNGTGNGGPWSAEQMYCPDDFEMLDAELTGAGSTSGTLSIVLGNKIGNPITITDVIVSGDVSGTSTGLSIDVAPGAQSPAITVSVSDILTYLPGDLVTILVEIEYTDNMLGMTASEICDVRKKTS